MKAKDYEMIAGIINGLPAETKNVVADHFARELHKRQPSFDLGAWEKRTGGTLKRFKVETEGERRTRIMAYVAASKAIGAR